MLLNEIFKDSKKPGRNGDETPNKGSYDSLNVIVENFQLAAIPIQFAMDFLMVYRACPDVHPLSVLSGDFLPHSLPP